MARNHNALPETGLMNAKDVSECLGVAWRTFRDWIRVGKVPASKVGKVWLVDMTEWHRNIKSQNTEKNDDGRAK